MKKNDAIVRVIVTVVTKSGEQYEFILREPTLFRVDNEIDAPAIEDIDGVRVALYAHRRTITVTGTIKARP